MLAAQYRLGHGHLSTTARHYTHATALGDDAVRRRDQCSARCRTNSISRFVSERVPYCLQMTRSAGLPNRATLEERAASLTAEARVVDRSGRHHVLAPEVVEAFADAIAAVQSPSDEMTIAETAALLGVSRPTLIRLLDTGALPHRRTQGTQGHCRIRRNDAVAYVRADLERRRHAPDELAADADVFGFCDR